ncbi:hypothetical protein RhiirA4_489187, partial [Rhizophagus irregularis]
GRRLEYGTGLYKKSGSFGDVIRQGSLRTFDFLSFFSLFFVEIWDIGVSSISGSGIEYDFGLSFSKIQVELSWRESSSVFRASDIFFSQCMILTSTLILHLFGL